MTAALAGRSVDETVGALLLRGHRRSLVMTLLVGVTTGLLVAYALLYPFSSLSLPRYVMAGAILLGVYIDYFAGSMLGRILSLIAAAIVAYVVGFVAYTTPALLGWYADPIASRALYLNGLKTVFVFTIAAAVLLLVGTFVSYVVRRAYAEFVR